MANVAVLGRFIKGKHVSPKTEFTKGSIPWNKGKMGVQVSTRKGKKLKPLSEEIKRKISLSISKEKHPLWNGGKPKCSICGKILSGYNNKKCTKHKGLKGKDSPNWKGGVTTKDRLERIRFRYTIQKQVLERDNYTCQMCGSKGDLQVDHIQSWKDYIELRFDMNSCRTLCMDCHYFITFGKKKPKNIVWGHNLGRRMSKFQM